MLPYRKDKSSYIGMGVAIRLADGRIVKRKITGVLACRRDGPELVEGILIERSIFTAFDKKITVTELHGYGYVTSLEHVYANRLEAYVFECVYDMQEVSAEIERFEIERDSYKDIRLDNIREEMIQRAEYKIKRDRELLNELETRLRLAEAKAGIERLVRQFRKEDAMAKGLVTVASFDVDTGQSYNTGDNDERQ